MFFVIKRQEILAGICTIQKTGASLNLSCAAGTRPSTQTHLLLSRIGFTQESAMPTGSWVKRLAAWSILSSGLILTCSGSWSQTHPSIQSSGQNRTQKDILEFSSVEGKVFKFSVERNPLLAADQQHRQPEVIATPSPDLFVMIDTAASRPGPMSRCQAGLEKTLRIVSIRGTRALQTRSIPLESCNRSIELSSAGVVWDEKTSRLKIDWLSGPTRNGMTESLVIRLFFANKPPKPTTYDVLD
jgi:hypothetical protein